MRKRYSIIKFSEVEVGQQFEIHRYKGEGKGSAPYTDDSAELNRHKISPKMYAVNNMFTGEPKRYRFENGDELVLIWNTEVK